MLIDLGATLELAFYLRMKKKNIYCPVLRDVKGFKASDTASFKIYWKLLTVRAINTTLKAVATMMILKRQNIHNALGEPALWLSFKKALYVVWKHMIEIIFIILLRSMDKLTQGAYFKNAFGPTLRRYGAYRYDQSLHILRHVVL